MHRHKTHTHEIYTCYRFVQGLHVLTGSGGHNRRGVKREGHRDGVPANVGRRRRNAFGIHDSHGRNIGACVHTRPDDAPHGCTLRRDTRRHGDSGSGSGVRTRPYQGGGAQPYARHNIRRGRTARESHQARMPQIRHRTRRHRHERCRHRNDKGTG